MRNPWLLRGQPTEVRFWYYVNIQEKNDCWLWNGSKLSDGYGAFKLNGKMVRAHRYAYEQYNGSIPDGLLVLHKCDTPLCCNPNHLFVGTSKDNTLDCVSKGRMPVGSNHRGAKLTEDEVRRIRILFSEGHSFAKLGSEFGVTWVNIAKICHRETWKHVEV
jgi:hypothetical protein